MPLPRMTTRRWLGLIAFFAVDLGVMLGAPAVLSIRCFVLTVVLTFVIVVVRVVLGLVRTVREIGVNAFFR